MPPHKREELRAVQSDAWEVIEATPKRAIRGAQPVAEDAFLSEITKSGRLTTVDSKTLRSQPRRAAVPSTLDLEMDAEPDAAYLVMARHESGAIVFVRPTQTERAARHAASRRALCVFRFRFLRLWSRRRLRGTETTFARWQSCKGHRFEGSGQAGRHGHARAGQGRRDRGVETQESARGLEVSFAQTICRRRIFPRSTSRSPSVQTLLGATFSLFMERFPMRRRHIPRWPRRVVPTGRHSSRACSQFMATAFSLLIISR